VVRALGARRRGGGAGGGPVSARGAFRLAHTRGGAAPALLADPERVDRVEVVDIATGESVLFWEGSPREAARLARALRRDLERLDPAEFAAAWLDG